MTHLRLFLSLVGLANVLSDPCIFVNICSQSSEVLQVTVLAALLAAPLVAAQNSSAVMGTDILNFALNLECLEAEFYSWAAYGKGLNATMRGGGPETDGPTGLPDGGMAFAGDDVCFCSL